MGGCSTLSSGRAQDFCGLRRRVWSRKEDELDEELMCEKSAGDVGQFDSDIVV
jgi:hypothetical protein